MMMMIFHYCQRSECGMMKVEAEELAELVPYIAD